MSVQNSEVKKRERLLSITPRDEHQTALLNKNFDSAHKITSLSQTDFVNQMADELGEQGAQRASEIYEAAKQRTNQVMHVWAQVNSLLAPHSMALRANAVAPSVIEYFKGMDGYQDFFGSLNYCDCAECKSIFGPAAYFVDLLRIVDMHVTLDADDGSLMRLDERRPDLKLIPLTCENTNDTIPYINIVNQRLENSLSALGTGSALYQKVAQTNFPFNLPFHLPLTKIRASLARFDTSLSDILRLTGAHADGNSPIAAELIQVSPEEWDLLTTSNTKAVDLQGYYGVSDLSQLNTLDAFCKQTGLTVLQAQELFNQNLSGDELKAQLNLGLFINFGQTSAPSIADGNIQNLTDNNVALDRIHRFIRLADKLGWSFEQLDWALHAASWAYPSDNTSVNWNWTHDNNKVSKPVEINPTSLTTLAKMQDLSRRYKLSISDILAFHYDLQTTGAGDDATNSEAAFDKIFNGAGQPVSHPTYVGNKLYTDEVKTWDSTKADDTNQKLSLWVAAGAGLRERELKSFVMAHFDGTLELTVENLSTVYRHARLSQRLQLPMQDYLLFLDLFDFAIPAFPVEMLGKIFETREVLRRSGLDVYQLNYAVNKVDSPYVKRPYQPDQPGITDGPEHKWLDALKKLIPADPVSDTATIATNPAANDTVKIAGSDMTPAQAQKDVRYRKLLTQLSSLLHTDEKTIESLLAVLKLKIEELPDIFLTDQSTAIQALQDLTRWLVIIQSLKLTVKDLATIAESPQNYFAAPPWPSAKEILELFLFKEAQGILADASEELLGYMNAVSTEDAARALASLLQIDAAQIKDLLDDPINKPPQATRIAALRRVMQITALRAEPVPEFLSC